MVKLFVGEEEGYGKNRDGKFHQMRMSESSKRQCQAGRWPSEHGAQWTDLSGGWRGGVRGSFFQSLGSGAGFSDQPGLG